MSARASASTSTRWRLSTWSGAIMMLASAVRCGNRLYCWNTMPTLRRSLSLSSLGALTSWPSTVIEPESIGTSALIQRSRVDLPAPDGPMIQITSPFITSIEMPLMTVAAPNFLCTSRMRISGCAGVQAQVITTPSSRHLEAPFQRGGRARDWIAINEEPGQQVEIHRHQQLGAPFRREDIAGQRHRLADADDGGEGRGHHHDGVEVHPRRRHALDALRQDDEPQRLQPREGGRFGRLPFAGRDRLPR